MAQRKTPGELGKTIAGKWNKSQKREKAARQIMEARKQSHQIFKKIKQQSRMI